MVSRTEMDGAIVRTVMGDVRPTALGRVSAHDHLVVMGGLFCVREPEFRLDDIDGISTDVAEFASSGGGTIVDACALCAGRSALALAEVSLRTGVHVVACTGFPSLEYYLDTHWVCRYDASRLADLVVHEVIRGMDEHCFDDPDPAPTPHRAGVAKLAADWFRVPPGSERLFAAVAEAHHRTGVPILVHTEQGTGAHEVLDVLEREGVQPGRVLLSHVDRNPDLVLHRELAARGAVLGYDWLSRIRHRPDSVVTELVLGLQSSGQAGAVTLGLDLVRHTYWPAYGGGPGLRYLFGEYVPRLKRAGATPETIRAICIDTPSRFLSFVPKEDL